MIRTFNPASSQFAFDFGTDYLGLCAGACTSAASVIDTMAWGAPALPFGVTFQPAP